MSVQLDLCPVPDTARSVPTRAETRATEPPATTPRALGPFFWLAARSPRMMRALRAPLAWMIPYFAGSVRGHTRRNALRIFGRALDGVEQRAFTRGVVKSFYEFVVDVGQSCAESTEQLLQRVERVEGEAEYRAMRRTDRGAVLVTAHIGSFEVGLAALKRVERCVHVVYKRDASGPFESMRTGLRRRLGVIESPIDKGLATWMALRDALNGGGVVVMQADRAMPGQRSAVVPFLHGHLRVPTGAVRLARLTGSPIVPVFTVRLASGRFAMHLCRSIEPGDASCTSDSDDPAVLAIARSIELMVARYPTQWLMLGPAFEEDVAHA